MASVLKVDKLDPQSGTALEIGSSGDTITIPSGATFTQSGTMNASAITAGTVATARLGTGTASSSTVLHGDNTWAAAGGANTPYFKFRSDGQTITTATDTLIEFDTEVFKSTDSVAFDTTNHRYLPTTAGYYVIHSSVRLNEDATGDRFIIQIRKNGTVGSADGSSVIDQDINDYSSVQATALIECDGSSDYIDAIIYQNTGSDKTILGHSAYSFFEGYKIIG